ncbi:[protein-PII] uridylyltransferase [Rhodobacteraceae bacterium NNCM2]|nr:[protein-PII] uridylyltransferase [Coraliihabitans acroporae]
MLADRQSLIARIDEMFADKGAKDAETLHGEVVAMLAEAHENARAVVLKHLLEEPFAGLRIARSFAHVTDVTVSATFHYCSTYRHPAPIRTKSEQMAVLGVGGYGRGEMAPFSDVDLLFLTPYKQTAWGESVIESMLYILWDLKLKVGQSVRSMADCMRYAANDFTIRTAVLENRFICGEENLRTKFEEKLWKDLFANTGAEFAEAKLAERDSRHERQGGSRYMVEPNIKEGKGGLRDLQTLHWVSKYIYHTETAWDLVEMGIFEKDEVQKFANAAKFIWAVRCHLHDLNGRAQEILSFDRQIEVAARMGFHDSNGRRGVERFMQAYFRHAKNVGDLTRIFLAALEAQHAKSQPTLSLLLSALSFRSSANENGIFVVRDGRLSVRDETVFTRDPVNMMRLFHEAARTDAKIHPVALRLVTQHLDLVDEALREDEEANRLFVEILCDKTAGARILRRMNETDFLGLFIPDFGRIVAMMQFNMYHHYTVDEHTIQTISMLNQIDRLQATEDLPIASEIIKGGFNRRVLYVALFMHDLGKGMERSHSETGAEIAAKLCPRLGLTESESDLVVWLVRHHLLMSDTAQKRDINDPGTVREFANQVQSPERLRLLLVLTVCDIRGVGPGVWNNWKAQLLRNLYSDTRDLLTGGAEQASRLHRVDRARAELAAAISDWPKEEIAAELARHYPHYWLGLETEFHVRFAEMARNNIGGVNSQFMMDEERDATVALLYMQDHPGIFSRVAGAFALAGANVVDARTYSTSEGMICSSFTLQDADGHPFEQTRLPRLKRTIERTLMGEVIVRDGLKEKVKNKSAKPFEVPTRIIFDNESSDLYTIIEVNARDRLGLLHLLTRTLSNLNINIFTAVIATYGEHAVDVFYVRDLFGLKISAESKQRLIEARLVEAIGNSGAPGKAATGATGAGARRR